MKAVMYHYVRHHDEALPHQRYLHVDDFERQLDWLGEQHGFVAADDWEQALDQAHSPNGVVLTFDDALRDHAEVVLPILLRRGLWGIFYVPTAPYRTGKLLAVHRVHHLVGTFGGRQLLRTMHDVVDDSMLQHDHVTEFHTATYGRLDDDAATDEFKRTLNYLIAGPHRDAALDAMSGALGVDDGSVAAGYYCSPDQLRGLRDAGMVIGSHSDEHVVLSTLTLEQQRVDIERSFSTLDDIVGSGVDSFCYPFGGFHTFGPETEAVLADLGIRSAFNVEPRDIVDQDLLDRPTALPRYDCNAFPFGVATRGRTPAARGPGGRG